MVRKRVVYSGRVQGVGFRATARAMASGFAVSGWVRNEPDETVTLEVQGEAGEVGRFLAILRERMGRLIRSVAEAEAAAVPGEEGFEVRR
jgi:acylphosphatase